jgi:MFS family permease
MDEHQLPSTQAQKDPKVFLILGWIFTALTLFILPFLFGPAAIVMGALAIRRGAKTQGILIIALSILFFILSIVLGLLAISWLSNNMQNLPAQ